MGGVSPFSIMKGITSTDISYLLRLNLIFYLNVKFLKNLTLTKNVKKKYKSSSINNRTNTLARKKSYTSSCSGSRAPKS